MWALVSSCENIRDSNIRAKMICGRWASLLNNVLIILITPLRNSLAAWRYLSAKSNVTAFSCLRSAKGCFSGYCDEGCYTDRINSVSDARVPQSADWEEGLILPALPKRWNPLSTQSVCGGSGHRQLHRWIAAQTLQQLCNSAGRAGAACTGFGVKNCLVST